MGTIFVDTETTGLDPRRHEIWEIGMIEENGTEHLWYPQLHRLMDADLIALNIGKFHERYPVTLKEGPFLGGPSTNWEIAEEIVTLTWGKNLVGAVPSFDEERLRHFIWDMNMCPGWHYHLLDIESMCIGYLRGRGQWPITDEGILVTEPPWKYDDIKRALGVHLEEVDPEKYEKHTAMGDARLVRNLYKLIMG